MNYKKIIVFFAMINILMILFVGCNKSTIDKVYNDSNKIASVSDTWGLDESNQTIEPGIYKGSLKLSGSGTIWTYDSSSDIDLKVPYILSVKSGKAKIVLISPDNMVVTLIESTSKATMEGTTSLTVPIKKGNNRIKLVGYEKSDVDIELHIEKGIFKKISL